MSDEYVLPQVASEVAKALNRALTSVQTVNGTPPDASGNVEIKVGSDSSPNANQGMGWTTEQINLLDELFNHVHFNSAEGGTIADNLIASLRGEGNGDTGGEEEPDEPVAPEVTLSNISAVYSGGSVAAGTALTDLTGIVVTAHHSDGTSETVTDYTLSGEIAEGSNTITVSYGGKTTTFSVMGVAESGGEDEPGDSTVEIPAEATRLAYIESTGTQYVDTGVKLAYVNGADFTADIDANVGSQADIFGAYDGTTTTYFRYYQNSTVGKFGWLGGASNFTCADYLGESMKFKVRNAAYNIEEQDASVTTYLYKDDASVCTSSVADTSVVSTADLYLFARNNNGTASQFAKYKLREFIIYADYECTEEILHLIPVRDPDGVACMYDTVSKQYFRNAGTGNFAGGES